VCTDQDAVDLVRQTQDPLTASKQLVDHALARFSTDNLSCMIVRFNSRAVQDTVEQRTEPIGVDGDPPSTVKGGISETEAIVGAVRKSLNSDGQSVDLEKIDTEMILEGQEEDPEPGPELDPEGLKKAREKASEGQKQADEEE
jgi:protein phosphatase PTC1